VISGEADECSSTDMAAMVVGICRLPRNWRPDLNSATPYCQTVAIMQLTAPPISIGFLDRSNGNINLAQSIAAKRETPTSGKAEGLLLKNSRGDKI
jgi:hypothetical protein